MGNQDDTDNYMAHVCAALGGQHAPQSAVYAHPALVTCEERLDRMWRYVSLAQDRGHWIPAIVLLYERYLGILAEWNDIRRELLAEGELGAQAEETEEYKRPYHV